MAIASSPVLKQSREISESIERIGHALLRYGLVIVIGWIGFMKFTSYEASGIEPLVARSPLMGWTYHFVSVTHFSDALGAVEIAIAILLALRSLSPRLSAIGGIAAALMFITTLSFLFSTPGWEASLGGFPALSAGVGQFLLKDLVLCGAAIWCIADSMGANRIYI